MSTRPSLWRPQRLAALVLALSVALATSAAAANAAPTTTAAEPGEEAFGLLLGAVFALFALVLLVGVPVMFVAFVVCARSILRDRRRHRAGRRRGAGGTGSDADRSTFGSWYTDTYGSPWGGCTGGDSGFGGGGGSDSGAGGSSSSC